jgi:cell volume regulation protein A
MTQDVLLTLSLVLIAALVARFLASLLRIPEILLLVAMGALFGPSALDVVDAPLDSIGAQLMFTLGVSLILFYGGLNLSLPLLRRVWLGLGMLVVPGVLLTALITGVAAYLVFDLPFEAALLVGAVLSPTDPAILIRCSCARACDRRLRRRWSPSPPSTIPPAPRWHSRWRACC